MPTYVALLDWTDQGVRAFRESVDRYQAASEQFGKLGVSFKEVYWTLGAHDLVAIVDAPDDEALAAALLSVASQGNIRTTTMRAFSADEMRSLIGKAP